MFWHQVGSTLIIAAIMTGCASTSTPSAIEPEKTRDRAVPVTHTNDGSIGDSGYLKGAAPNEIVKCRESTTTGSRLRRTTCGRGRDDSALFRLINRGSVGPPGQSN